MSADARARLVTTWDHPPCTCREHADDKVNERRVWAVVCEAVPIDDCGLLSLPYPNRASAIKAARDHRHEVAQ